MVNKTKSKKNVKMTREEMKKLGNVKLREIVYDRSARLIDSENFPTVHVLGVGGIGSWCSIDVAMAGCRNLHIYDDDILSASNLSRLPFKLSEVGEPKTKIVKKFIQERRPEKEFGTVVTCHGRINSEQDLSDVEDGDVVVICVDSAQENNKILELLKDKKVRVIRGAYNEDRIVVTDAGPQWSTDAGYGAIPSYVVPPQTIAALIVEKIMRTPDIDINAVPIGKLRGPPEAGN